MPGGKVPLNSETFLDIFNNHEDDYMRCLEAVNQLLFFIAQSLFECGQTKTRRLLKKMFTTDEYRHILYHARSNFHRDQWKESFTSSYKFVFENKELLRVGNWQDQTDPAQAKKALGKLKELLIVVSRLGEFEKAAIFFLGESFAPRYFHSRYQVTEVDLVEEIFLVCESGLRQLHGEFSQMEDWLHPDIFWPFEHLVCSVDD
jgi:hypothetical protein